MSALIQSSEIFERKMRKLIDYGLQKEKMETNCLSAFGVLNRVPQTERLVNNRNLLLTVLKAEGLR